MTVSPLKTTAMAIAISLAGLQAACATTPTAPIQQVATQPAAPASADLQVRFTGIKDARGFIMVALFNSEAAYDGNGAPVASARVEVTGDSVSANFPGLPAGAYGVKAFHDINGDGKLSTNPFGIPTEPFAFSNNAPAFMGPAKWAAANFAVATGAATHTITID